MQLWANGILVNIIFFVKRPFEIHVQQAKTKRLWTKHFNNQLKFIQFCSMKEFITENFSVAQ